MYNTFFVLHVFEQLLFVVQIFFRQPRILISFRCPNTCSHCGKLTCASWSVTVHCRT